MKQLQQCVNWLRRSFRWSLLLIVLAWGCWSIGTEIAALRVRQLWPQWLAQQRTLITHAVQHTAAPLWRGLPWDAWSRAPGVTALAAVTPDDIVVWGTPTDIATTLPLCAVERFVAAACRWHVTIDNADGRPLLRVDWALAPTAWTSWLLPRWLQWAWWSATLGLAWFWCGQHRIRCADALSVAVAPVPTDTPRVAAPGTVEWAIGAADVVAQPVLILDPHYCVAGVNGCAYGLFPQLRRLLGQHWYDVAEQLSKNSHLLAVLDRVSGSGPVSHYQPGAAGEPGIGVARLMAGDRCYGYWLTLDPAETT